MKTQLIAALCISLCTPVFASSFSQPAATLKHSQQMIMVVSSDWDSPTGELQRFERNKKTHHWQKVGPAIPVVVGKHGMGWDPKLQVQSDKEPTKAEGDGRTPVGVYQFGPTFGFNDKSTLKVDYFPITETSVCVDDGKSTYYNQLLDSAKVPKVDWNSGEQMKQVPGYKIGGVIQYNQDPSVPGKGSCIFMHIWKGPTAGTAGCVAMEETNLQGVLNWLERTKKPVVVIFPKPAYQTMKAQLKLPELA